jgi:hypothetical protein
VAAGLHGTRETRLLNSTFFPASKGAIGIREPALPFASQRQHRIAGTNQLILQALIVQPGQQWMGAGVCSKIEPRVLKL